MPRLTALQRQLAAPLAITVLLHLSYAFAPSLHAEVRPTYFLAASLLMAILLLSCSLGQLLSGKNISTSYLTDEMTENIFAGVAVAVVASSVYTSHRNYIAIPLVGILFVLQIAAIKLRRVDLSLGISALVLSISFAVILMRTQIDSSEADMLPVILWANDTFSKGLNPYYEDYTSVTPGPFYYLPVQWLIYWPFSSTGLDPRLLNVISIFGVVALARSIWRDFRYRWLTWAVLIAILASRPSFEMLIRGHVWPLWFLTSAFAFAVLRERLVLSALLLGFLLALSQTALLFAAFFGVYILRRLAKRPLYILMLIIVCLGVFCCIMIPFSREGPKLLLDLYVNIPRIAGQMSEAKHTNSILQVSLVHLLKLSGIDSWRTYFQVAVGLTGMAVLALGRRPEPGRLLYISGLAYVVAMGLNFQVWKYYYFPGIFLMLWSAYQPTLHRPVILSGFKPLTQWWVNKRRSFLAHYNYSQEQCIHFKTDGHWQ